MRRALLIGLVAVGVAALAAAGRWGWEVCRSSPRLAIAQIQVEGTRRVAPDSIIAASGIAEGANILRLDPKAVERRLARHPWVAAARVQRHLPGTVAIRVVEREPLGLLATRGWCALDGDGNLLPVEMVRDTLELPLVAGCVQAEGLDAARLRKAGAFLRTVGAECSFLLRDLSEVNVSSPSDLTVTTVRSATSIRLGDGDYAEKLARLLFVLEDLSGREEMPLSIDLRFHGQAVVRFRGA
jgi:cell division protein FtsQ